MADTIIEGVPFDVPDESLPPVDWAMVRESMAAIARGEGELIEDLVRRLESEPR